MKRAIGTLVLTATLVVCQHCGVYAGPPSPGGAGQLAPEDALRGLAWLEGRWVGSTSDGEAFEAIYSSPAGGVILSVSRSLSGERATFTEFERFEVREGRVVMTPFPDGRRGCAFMMVEHDMRARRAVFTNPENDFPRRIVYERPADDALRIVVEDMRGAEVLTLVLDLRRG